MRNFASRLNVDFSPLGLAALTAPQFLPVGFALPLLNVRYHLGEDLAPKAFAE